MKKTRHYKIVEMQYSDGDVKYCIKKKSRFFGLWLTYVVRANHYVDDLLWGIFSFDPVLFDTVRDAEMKIYELADTNPSVIKNKVVEMVDA